METEAILRFAAGSKQFAPVRRFISRWTGGSDTTAPSALALDRWHEERATMRRAPGARSAAWFEQAEFWADEGQASPAPAKDVGASKREAARDDAMRVEVVIDDDPLPVVDEHKPRTGAVRMMEVMKFLQVNDGVSGACRRPLRFALPRQGCSPRLQLWRGAPVGTHFVTGC